MWLGIKNNHRQSQKQRQQWQARATLTMRRMSNAAMRGRTMDGLAVCLSVCSVRIVDLATALLRVVMLVKQEIQLTNWQY